MLFPIYGVIIYIFVYQQNLPERVEVAILYVLWYLCNDEKRDDDKKYDLPEWLTNIVHSYGSISEDTGYKI